MKKRDLRIVYMDTSDFAMKSLRALVKGGYNVVDVIAIPDKSMGRRGSVLQPSIVKQYVVSVGLPVLQPERLKDETFSRELRASWTDSQIVAAFRVLLEVVWSMPRLGTFSLRASLLPQYRGAVPISWVVIDGDMETGMTTFFLTHEVDMDRIVRQKYLPIADTDNVETAHDALMTMGVGLATETVDLPLDGKTGAIPQEELYKDAAGLHPAPKIFRGTRYISRNQPMKKIYGFIRELSLYPAAWTRLISAGGKRMVLKAYQTKKRPAVHNFPVGSVHIDHKSYIGVAVKDGFPRLHSLQLAGKKRMNTTDSLSGLKQITECTVG